MSSGHNTLFLRLAGPMQSWGTSSRFQLRRTDIYPSKSGVLGMLLCARGVRREDSEEALEPLNRLLMGVRVDRSGKLDWDYHTAGAKIGIRQALDGKSKITQSTKEYETLLSRRQYLYDASFLVALQGDSDMISASANALQNPIWPLFLGRKCCIPAEPVFAGTGSFDTLTNALSSIPWQPRIVAIDRFDNRAPRISLDIYIEHSPGSEMPIGARIVHDVPRKFGFFNYYPRLVIKDQVTAPVGETIQKLQPYTRRGDPYSKHFKEVARPSRLKLDNYLCVFCKLPATEVHHVSYENAGQETDSDLRSLCEICHDACTMLEYGHNTRTHRVDPSDPALRLKILHQIQRLLQERRSGQRRQVLRTVRKEL
ncbi:MAG: type I-E CRISPR-associated protein Cas5/CasD [Desulfobaccales bacterium]|jgi:CRISPR system Cascade subunit CasD